MSKTIDYLFEDPAIPSQKYALISIVGPHMPQKCDVWGLKIRGVTDSLESAKSMTQRLMRIDENYDIYTVDIGKFFPLAVEPHQLNNVEYQNSQLNQLVKSYLENRELANEQWHKRKADLVQQAIKEGKNQEEFANRPEHPVAVLQRIRSFEDELRLQSEKLNDVKKDLELAKQKFSNYTEEEKELAQKELLTAVDGNDLVQNSSIENIREQLLSDLSVNEPKVTDVTEENDEMKSTIKEIKQLEQELTENKELLKLANKETSPNVYKRLEHEIKEQESKLQGLKYKLTSTEKVNEFINSNYSSSEWDYLSEKSNHSNLTL